MYSRGYEVLFELQLYLKNNNIDSIAHPSSLPNFSGCEDETVSESNVFLCENQSVSICPEN